MGRVIPIYEKDIKRDIVRYLKINGVFCWVNVSGGIWDPKKQFFRKQNGFGMILGASDILGLYKGTFIAIEVKRKPNKPTREQEFFLSQIRRQGGLGLVAYSLEDVIERFKGIFNNA